ncbi:MAG: gamma-glutamyltransferase [Proteobacteria bacterium]|nr:gamma-glutamyltransferase [Pseudomonadota bacterium]
MTKAMVVAPQSEPADVALEVLEQGGNAFDAAVAGAFAQGVVDPHRSGIGGFGAAALYSASENKVRSISFFGLAGSSAKPDMWEKILKGPAPDGFGYILDGKLNDVGYQSITTPGTVAGLGAIHERFGSLPWRRVLDGPASLARRGFLVGPQLAAFWRRPGLFGRVSTGDRLGLTTSGSGIWLTDGEPPKAGDIVKQDVLAATYDRLAEAGPEDFYRGEIARQIVEDFKKNQALVTEKDLSRYEAQWQEPLVGEFLGNQIFSTPLPGGGVALLQALYLSKMKRLLDMRLNSTKYVDLLANILSAIQSDRTNFHADPDFHPQDISKLLSEGYLDKMLSSRNVNSSKESPDTTELAVVDKWGNGIILSHSLGYGSGVFTPGLGFMYNNCMSGFDPIPGKANSIAPGKARSTAIAQTIVCKDGQPKLIIGSPGGSHITAGIAQALINYLHFGFDLQDAVCRPRLDAYRQTLLLESRMPYKLEDDLADKWEIKRSPNPFGQVGRIYGIAYTKNGLKPGYDPGEPATVREL